MAPTIASLCDDYQEAHAEDTEAEKAQEAARLRRQETRRRLDGLQARLREALRPLPGRQLHHDGFLYQLKTSPGSGVEQLFRSECETAEGLDADAGFRLEGDVRDVPGFDRLAWDPAMGETYPVVRGTDCRVDWVDASLAVLCGELGDLGDQPSPADWAEQHQLTGADLEQARRWMAAHRADCEYAVERDPEDGDNDGLATWSPVAGGFASDRRAREFANAHAARHGWPRSSYRVVTRPRSKPLPPDTAEGLIPGSPIATEAAADYRPSPRPLDVRGLVARDGAHAATDDDGDDLLPGEMPTVGQEVLSLANGRASA